MNIVQMSISAAFIIVAAVIIRALLMYKLPKKTFLALWGVALCRLLIPFSVPAKTSVFSLIEYIRTQMSRALTNTVVSHPAGDVIALPNTAMTTVTNAVLQDTVFSFASPLLFVWLAGIAILGAHFMFVYFKCRREFSTSLPCDNGFIKAWHEKHGLQRAYSVRISDKIAVPLTFGILRPVILLPKKTDFSDEQRLSYILMHEVIHIKSFDALTKLIATAALCVHWFNPLVWVMYILLNRDIEISCDERVIREFGETPKSAYALTLIGMEEKKSSLSPLYSGFSKYAIEERINAIMKMKKGTFVGIAVAVLLVVLTTTVFATSALGNAAARENEDTAIGWITTPGDGVPNAPHKPLQGMTLLPYLHSLNLLQYDDTPLPVYRYNGLFVKAVYDPCFWQGNDYSEYVGVDVSGRYGKAVALKTVRDARTNEIVGLVEMTDEEMNAARDGTGSVSAPTASGYEAPAAPYQATEQGYKNNWEYLHALGLLAYDDRSFYQPIYRFNGKWVSVLYDPIIWNGTDFTSVAQQYDGDLDFGESVGVRVVRDAQSNEITGLVEMTDEEMNAVLNRSGMLSSDGK
jgi:beta-lactamase regulating signal transducer with metallopeptidase domain